MAEDETSEEPTTKGYETMNKPRLLDLFCGAGGAAMGYYRAGFEVVGVDIAPQKHYPFEFHRADAMTFPLEGFDVIHASPPCEHYSVATRSRGAQARDNYPDSIPPTRQRLVSSGKPWIIENVPYAPLNGSMLLCGSMFGLEVRRHREFETSWGLFQLMPTCMHHRLLPFLHRTERAYTDAMGCEWMTNREGRKAIPPAYTEWLGRQLLAALDYAKAG